MEKPTVYLDASFVSMLFLRGRDVVNVSRHMASRVWWEDESGFFRVEASKVVEDELAKGHYVWRQRSLDFVRKLPYLPLTHEVRHCAQLCLREHLVPQTKVGDAFQLAFAVVHRVDYLMSWNYAHLANVGTQRRLEELAHAQVWRCPLLVTPETVPKAALGHELRRRDSHD